MKSVLRGLTLCVLLPQLAGCIAPAANEGYYTPPLSGRVTDRLTHQPLAGVRVYAQERNVEGATLSDATGQYTLEPLRSQQTFKILVPTGGIFHATVYYEAPGYETHTEEFEYMFAGQYVEDLKHARVLDVALVSLP